DPVTTLTAATVMAFLEHAFHEVARRAGLLPPDPAPFLVLYRERSYLNLSLCLEMGRRLPGFDATDMERLILGAGAGGGMRARVPMRAWPRLVRVLARLQRMGRQLPGEAAPRVNRLVTGLPGLESAAPVEALEALAAEVRAQPEWIAWLSQPAIDAAAAWRRHEAPAGLGPRLDEFLSRWGHRGVSEGELRAASWEDDPAPLLAALGAR